MGDRDDAVRDELARVLASDAFVASPMLAAFLRYVVEETLAGRDDRLKAYSIAVGALGRAQTFDPNDNPLVRVQARRLRLALRRHYEGRADLRLRIELPLGTYVPLFHDVAAAAEPAAGPAREAEDAAECDAPSLPLPLPEPAETSPPPPTPPPPTRGERRGAVIGAVALLLAGIAIGAVATRWREVAVAPPSPPPEVAVAPVASRNLDASRLLPLVVVEVEVRNAALLGFDGEIFRNRIETFAQRFDDTVVISRRSPDYPAPAGQPLYRLHFIADRDGTGIRLYYRLLHAGDERLVRSGDLALRTEPAAKETMPRETPPELALVRDLVQLHGAITRDLADLDDISSELTCLGQAWHYFTEPTADNNRIARSCLTPVVAENPRLVPALTMLGAMYLCDYRQGFADSAEDPLVRADVLLRRAGRIAPASSAPHRILLNLLHLRGDTAAALVAGARAIELNPEDMNAVGAYGSLLARIGRYEEALTLLRRAAADMDSPPRWMQYFTFLALNNLGRTDEADRQVALFEGTRSSLFLTAVAIRAHRRGDAAGAGAALEALATLEPDFVVDRRTFLRRRGLADAVIDRLAVDLPPPVARR
jgi:hypothetical protein